MNGFDLVLVDAMSPRAEAIWSELEVEHAPSYFLSWAFVENWLASLPAENRPKLAVSFRDGRPLGAFLLGAAEIRRHGLVHGRGRFMNASGVPRFDEVTVEHNAVLCARPLDWSLAAFVDALPDDWDELVLPALARRSFPGRALDEPLKHHVVRIEAEAAAPYVDLARVRLAPGGYLSLLGKNTRAEIRRARRGYGEIIVEAADDESSALDVFDELVRLHGASWRARGAPGAFSDPWFVELHRRLIRNRTQHGEIQLLRVRTAERTIGCLYNLVSNGNVLFYQSGLALEEDPRKKPGYVCHAEAVELNARAGLGVYDLLAGEGRYKSSLATDSSELVWARIQRPLARFRAEERLRRWKRALWSKGQSP